MVSSVGVLDRGRPPLLLESPGWGRGWGRCLGLWGGGRSLWHNPARTVNTTPEMAVQFTRLLSNLSLRIDTHHHYKIEGTSVPFPVGCLLSQLRISTNELLNHLAGWRLLCICDLCRLIFCVNRVKPTVFIVTQQYSLSLHGMKIACRLYNACSIVHNPD